MRSLYTEAAGRGLPNPTHLVGEVRRVLAQYQQVVTTRSSRIVTQCLLTRSMLYKMYIHAFYTQSRIWTIVVIYEEVYHYNTCILFDEFFQS